MTATATATTPITAPFNAQMTVAVDRAVVVSAPPGIGHRLSKDQRVARNPTTSVVVVAVAGFTVYRLRGVFGSHTTTVASVISDDTKPFNPKHVTYEIFGEEGAVDGKAAYVQLYLAGNQGESLANESDRRGPRRRGTYAAAARTARPMSPLTWRLRGTHAVYRVLKRFWIPLLLVVVVAVGAYAVLRIRGPRALNARVRRRAPELPRTSTRSTSRTRSPGRAGPPTSTTSTRTANLISSRTPRCRWSFTIVTTLPSMSANIMAQGDRERQ